ncbi:MAG TPA: sigma-54 dependent transcriptional regulator [Hyphomonadaceae bacterium]|nr:sigma-54 dependent transcriptional regulator [Hyphomonadaceae bacterium]HPN04576.1 sigma-54 dependent transcriptional regulator [Hyphomonadaceae bacterium]
MRVLIIGNLAGQLSAATKIAFEKGAKVLHAPEAAHAMDLLRTGRGADIVMIDVHEDITGLVGAMKQERIVAPVVACGVNVTPDMAARAIRAGAREFIPLPPDPELIAAVLSAVADDDRPLIANDPSMLELRALADQIAPSEASVLITGESGVGKEVMARYVHRKSKRADKPFISVNCAAIPENLLESELFGHEKGAFTGAVARRIGKFEEADGGTLLLDEISEMDIRLQAKLLRAIQEREIDRVGGSKPVPVNIRIIATSNRILQEAVIRGEFRKDLLYRLNVMNLHIPPLRERPRDLASLADFFVNKYANANGLSHRRLSDAASERVQAAAWMGNVRELENAMHRAVILARGEEISVDDLRTPDGRPVQANALDATAERAVNAAEAAIKGAAIRIGQTVAEVEQDLILSTLDHCLGNRTHAANILGISIRTLRNKLRQYQDAGIEVAAPGEVRAAG